MINLKTIRLDFLNVGPDIQNMDIFENLSSLYLHNNKVQRIGQGLKMNVNLEFLALQKNQIQVVEGLNHLVKLAFLDMSKNKISELDVKQLPPNLMILKLSGNPCTNNPNYRKNVVTGLPSLEELDKLKVLPSERLTYQGLIKNVNVEELLAKLQKERKEEDARDKMEKELYVEYMESIG